MVNTPDDPNQAQAWISGTPPDQTIDFYIPRGNTGPRGPVGPIGPSLAVGSVATVTGPAAPGTVGATGLTGPKGDPGGLVNPTPLTTGIDWNTLITSGLYSAAGSDMAGMPNSPPSMAIGVNLMIQARASTIVTQIAWTVSNAHSQIQFQRSLVSGTWGPWKVYRNTTIDNTSGRAVYMWDETGNRSQLLYGDTGWRSITSGLINGWTGNNVKLRRYGSRVTFTAYALDGAAKTANQFYAVPVGYRPQGNTYVAAYSSAANGLTYVTISASDGLLGLPAAINALGGSAYAEVSWETTDIWPTTLPGTAFANIPNL
ncbi:hypothetical protein QCN32_gp22 [Arthrobacter phage Niktson]|uniref:Minor tail protein n=1 Tax=Arthrobacter phage Niktson TaxID=2014347 RepID=A0A218M5J7_9CAUD|nr:hypothetical protein QCN32_gp22 [Arthrobacter phage Niktson]ASD52247.1 hypothetical protein NIKTSON_22 [Arthrobacter phage Niktson]ASD52340.1 hypothetical protein ELEPHANTMAN_22 [Arthrobacter phage ElephantMan]